MDWFLYDNSLRHERVKRIDSLLFPQKSSENLCSNHIETISLICSTNQWIGFHMTGFCITTET